MTDNQLRVIVLALSVATCVFWWLLYEAGHPEAVWLVELIGG